MRAVVLGLDPALRSCGWALVELHADGSDSVISLGAVLTKKSNKKKGIRVADDDVRAVREIAERIHAIVLAPALEAKVLAIATELPSGAQGAKPHHALGIAKGFVGTFAQVLGLPMAQCSPRDLKLVVTGEPFADKEEVQRALVKRYGQRHLFAGIEVKEVEHAADALGAVVACLDSDVLRMARRMSE